ncbi:MAG: hypothetical protein EBX40_08600 [Gammaproteobacteria bacterium]|nr:hypothetical protein [Gammaproteobacteria bacterium]
MTAYGGAAITTTPTIATATNTQVLAANPFRKLLIIQNASAAHVGVGLNGQTLTGIAPSATNICLNLTNNDNGNRLMFVDGFVPTGPITIYQTSGASINTVVIIEG